MEQTAMTSEGNVLSREPMLSVRQLVKRFGGLTAVNRWTWMSTPAK
jgi:hypothetical protein